MITKVELKNVIPFAKGLIIDKLNRECRKMLIFL